MSIGILTDFSSEAGLFDVNFFYFFIDQWLPPYSPLIWSHRVAYPISNYPCSCMHTPKREILSVFLNNVSRCISSLIFFVISFFDILVCVRLVWSVYCATLRVVSGILPAMFFLSLDVRRFCFFIVFVIVTQFLWFRHFVVPVCLQLIFLLCFRCHPTLTLAETVVHLSKLWKMVAELRRLEN